MTATTAPVVSIYFGGTAVDVSAYVRSVSAHRGRSRELDTFTSGGCTVMLKNYDRRFDPTNRSSPYYGQLVPRVRVTVTSESIGLFDGFVEDWNLSYDVSGYAEAVVSCVDGLALISQTALDTFVNTQDTPAERMTTILARPDVDFPGSTDLDPGLAVLQSDTVADGTNTLQYLQTVAATDLGRLFVDGAGTLRYRDRTSGVTSSASVIFGSQGDALVDSIGAMSDATLWLDASAPDPIRVDATGVAQTVIQEATLWLDASEPDYVAPLITFNSVELEYGSEFLFNRIIITRAGGTAQTARDESSITTYGIRAYDASGLLFLSDAAAASFADYLATQYAQPAVRVASHEIVLGGLSALHQRYIKRLEIGDLVRTVWTPLGVGTGLDITSFVEGIKHDISPERHVPTFSVENMLVYMRSRNSAASGPLISILPRVEASSRPTLLRTAMISRSIEACLSSPARG
jgi:hypothetical protein